MLAGRLIDTTKIRDIRAIDALSGWKKVLEKWTGNKKQDAPLRERIFKTLEDPLYTPEALLIGIFMVAMILLSVITLFLSSLPENWLNQPRYIDILEIITTGVFTVDFLIRLCTAPVWWRWLIRPRTIADILSTIPWYLNEILQVTVGEKNFVRVLRILRIIRILKLGHFSDSFRVLSRTLRSQYHGVLLLLGLYTLGFTIWGTLMFFAEMTYAHFDSATEAWILPERTEAPFQSIPETFWWGVVTMSTTGYGDQVPQSRLGKFVASLCVTYGLVMLSLPIALLGTRFTEEWKVFKFTQLEEADLKGLQKSGLKKHEPQTDAEIAQKLRSHIDDIDKTLHMAGRRVEHMKRWKEDLTDLWCKSKADTDSSKSSIS